MNFNWYLFFHNVLNNPGGWMYLRYWDFSQYQNFVRIPAEWKNADLSFSYGLPENIDCSFCERINFSNVVFKTGTSIKLNQYSTEVNLSNTTGLYGAFECGGMGKVSFRGADMSNIFRFQGAKRTDLTGATGLFGLFDFRFTDYLNMTNTDVSHAQIYFNPNAKKINLTNVKGLSGVLDFGNAEHVVLFGADLSRVTKIICGPNTDLQGAVNFDGKIEYSTSKQLSQKIAGTKHVYRNCAKAQVRRYRRMGFCGRGSR